MRILLKKSGLEPKDQSILLDDSFTFIDDLNHRYDWNESDGVVNLEDIIISNYYGNKFWANFLTESRIDNAPIFIIDTTQVDRDNKISVVLS